MGLDGHQGKYRGIDAIIMLQLDLAESTMSAPNEPHDDPSPESGREEPLPLMQRLLDNPFLLLFLGVTIPTITYIIWGVMEIVTIPIGP